MYAQAFAGQEPDLEAEASKLGDNASTRIEAASAFASKFFPDEALPAIERMCESHEGIIALEAVMEAMKDGNFAGDTSPSPEYTEPELQEMMRDPRYHKDLDPELHRKVREGFERIYRK